MLRPKKRWGQNFLNDPNIAKKIISLLGDIRDEKILEIGSGDGALTKRIYAKKITAIEIDQELCNNLKKIENSNLFVINEDFLKSNLDDILFDKVIGNLPYNISSQIIFKILNHSNWDKAVFMIQKELADRIISKEGSRQYGRISIMIQAICQVKKEFNVSANCFFPKPDVESTVISLQKKKLNEFNYKNLEQIVKISFSQRRKKLKNTLNAIVDYDELEKFSNKRPEMLSVNDFIYISDLIKALCLLGFNNITSGIYNAGSGKLVSNIQYCNAIHKVMYKTNYLNYKNYEIKGFYANINKIRKKTGWEPELG